MKRILKVFSVIILVSLALLIWAVRVYKKDNIREMSVSRMIDAGTNYYIWLLHPDEGLKYAFPFDDELSESEQITFLHEMWNEVRTEKASEHARKYYDPNIWTIIKNLPDNPPDNLIVLATRNIDASSLRTRLTVEDLDKCIRIDEHYVPPENIPILKTAAVVINATGSRCIISTNPGYHQKFRRIYLDWKPWKPSEEPEPFDLTTNLVNGLEVKYLTTDGEVIPAND